MILISAGGTALVNKIWGYNYYPSVYYANIDTMQIFLSSNNFVAVGNVSLYGMLRG